MNSPDADGNDRSLTGVTARACPRTRGSIDGSSAGGGEAGNGVHRQVIPSLEDATRQKLSASLGMWDFGDGVFSMETVFGGDLLFWVLEASFSKFGMEVPLEPLYLLCGAIAAGYNDVPYHCIAHAVDVTHAICWILSQDPQESANKAAAASRTSGVSRSSLAAGKGPIMSALPGCVHAADVRLHRVSISSHSPHQRPLNSTAPHELTRSTCPRVRHPRPHPHTQPSHAAAHCVAAPHSDMPSTLHFLRRRCTTSVTRV